MIRPPPKSPLFPSTTLSRSRLPELGGGRGGRGPGRAPAPDRRRSGGYQPDPPAAGHHRPRRRELLGAVRRGRDRKSTRLNSSHSQISYAVFCLKKKKKHAQQ